MAHFAELNDQGVVLRVIVVNNSDIIDANGVESEAIGIEFCKSLFGTETTWIQTSYNSTFRKHYAAAGFTYDKDLDAFIPEKPFNSWVLNLETFDWDSPVPKPDDGKLYYWNEDILSWVLRPQVNEA